MSTRQATVADWDPATGGSALLDDGTRVPLPREALEGSVFRFLRLGQRVRLTFEGDQVTAIGLP